MTISEIFDKTQIHSFISRVSLHATGREGGVWELRGKLEVHRVQ